MATIDNILRRLRQKGLKVTPQRRMIVDDILNHQGATSAQDLLSRIGTQFPDMSLDTVYRNLNLLCDLGVLSKVGKKGKESSQYELETGHHHHYLICLRCGVREKLEFCCVAEASAAAVTQKGFEITSHKIEFYGLCQECKHHSSSMEVQ